MSRVVVVGAGIVGACCALALVRDGHRVTLLEPDAPGGPHAASFGNGAWISPASVVPMAMPGLWRKLPSLLGDRAGPLTIRPRYLPGLLPWLVRFLHAGSRVRNVERTARALASLLADAPDRHGALAASLGRPELVVRRGLLYAYRERTDFIAEALAWRLRADTGVAWRELDAAALRQVEPTLAPRYRFGVLVEGGAHCADPGGYVAAIVAAALREGASLERGTATGFALNGERLHAVTTTGAPIPCDHAVIAAGIRSKALARTAGNRVPLESERGYHVEIAAPSIAPAIPVMPADGRMANTRTLTGLRAAGQVELASVDAPPDWRRADILLAHLLATYPGLDAGASTRWMGHRPSTSDGLPVIGPARLSPAIVHAFGHGHVGLAAAPATSALVADLVAGRAPSIDPTPFSARRFNV